MLVLILSQIPALIVVPYLIYILARWNYYYLLFLAALFITAICFNDYCAASMVANGHQMLGFANHLLSLTIPSTIPLMYLFYQENLGRRRSLWRKLWLFIPAFALFVSSFLTTEDHPSFSIIFNGRTLVWDISEVIVGIEALCVMLRCYFDYTNYNGRYTRTREIDFMMIAFMLVGLVMFETSLIGMAQWQQMEQYSILNYCFLSLVYAIGQLSCVICANKRGETEDFINNPASRFIPGNYDDVEMGQYEPSRLEQLSVRLRKLLEEDKLYLKAGLRMEEMCQELGTNRTYLTRAMVATYNHTFIEQLNLMRIQSAQRDMLRRPSASIEDIALSNGFNSRVTFHKVFNYYCGSSPSVWRQKMMKEQKKNYDAFTHRYTTSLG